MGAKKDKTLRVPHALPVVLAAAEQALHGIGAQVGVRSPEQGTFSARMGATIWSFGEDLNVAVKAESPTVTIVQVSSEAGQLVDWGKNSQNLQQFEQALMKALATAPKAATRLKPAQKPAVRQQAPEPVAAPPLVRRIFLCYRRHDSGMIVGRIYDRLARDFGEENVFKDVDNIPFGVDFVDHLDGEVQKCGVLFAVIGPRWLEPGPQNAPRLEDPNDFVRIEIASALRRKIPVVPLLVDGAQMPRADQLPDDIKPLARRNGTEIRHDPDFHGDVTRLLSRLG